MLDVVHDKLNLRSVQYIHKDISSKTTQENLQVLRSGKKPDFTMISYYSLPSLFSFAAKVDAEFIRANNVEYRKLIAEGRLPTQKRQAFGIIYEKLNEKFLAKPPIEVLLEERPGLVAVPIWFYGDLDAYNHYRLPLCIQKVGGHYDKSSSSPQVFAKDQQRLDAWTSKNNIKLVDGTD